jgi:hypothetical protein
MPTMTPAAAKPSRPRADILHGMNNALLEWYAERPTIVNRVGVEQP